MEVLLNKIKSGEVHEIIQNSDTLYKSNIKWRDDIEYEEINQYEKDMLKDTLKPVDLLEREKTEEEKKVDYRRAYITKVKIIAFGRLNIYPLSNGSYLSSKDKRKVIYMMEEVMKLSEEEINKEFGEVCNDEIFTQKSDYSHFPTYDI